MGNVWVDVWAKKCILAVNPSFCFLCCVINMRVQPFKYNQVCTQKEGPSLEPFRIIPRRAVNVAMISLVSSIRGKEGWERGGVVHISCFWWVLSAHAAQSLRLTSDRLVHAYWCHHLWDWAKKQWNIQPGLKLKLPALKDQLRKGRDDHGLKRHI